MIVIKLVAQVHSMAVDKIWENEHWRPQANPEEPIWIAKTVIRTHIPSCPIQDDSQFRSDLYL